MLFYTEYLLINCVESVPLSYSVVFNSVTPWTAACQTHLSMGFSRQEYWSGSPFTSLGNRPYPGIEPRSPALQANSLSFGPPGPN